MLPYGHGADFSNIADSGPRSQGPVKTTGSTWITTVRKSSISSLNIKQEENLPPKLSSIKLFHGVFRGRRKLGRQSFLIFNKISLKLCISVSFRSTEKKSFYNRIVSVTYLQQLKIKIKINLH